ncbi:MAG: methyltransferase [Bacillota bacterium]
MGISGYALAVAAFARPGNGSIRRQGLYRFSRNPMYLIYYLFLLDTAFSTGSLPYLFLSAVFQLSVHWVILSEERWCLEQLTAD